jgi:hypothetical protein
MGYINQPPNLNAMFTDIERRLRKLETATRFTAPNVNFATSTPSNPRVGDIFFDTNSKKLVFWNGTNWRKITDSTFP